MTTAEWHAGELKEALPLWRQTASVLALGIRGLAGQEGSREWFQARELAALADQLADQVDAELGLLENIG